MPAERECEYEGLNTYWDEFPICSCTSWARCDYQSGFMSLHHAGCPNYDVEKEIRIMSIRFGQLQKTVATFSDILETGNKALEEIRNVKLFGKKE